MKTVWDWPTEVAPLAGHFAGLQQEALHMEGHSLVQICLQAGMHALDVVLPKRFLHLHTSMARSEAQQQVKLDPKLPCGISPARHTGSYLHRRNLT